MIYAILNTICGWIYKIVANADVDEELANIHNEIWRKLEPARKELDEVISIRESLCNDLIELQVRKNAIEQLRKECDDILKHCQDRYDNLVALDKMIAEMYEEDYSLYREMLVQRNFRINPPMDFSKPPEGCDHEKVKQAEAFFNRRRIVISAIKQPNGRIYIGLRHHNCIAAAADAGEEIPIIGEQGFLDNNGNFLGREEALPIAEAAGQIKEKTNPLYMLFSDVW